MQLEVVEVKMNGEELIDHINLGFSSRVERYMECICTYDMRQ